ncbi:MAG: hypothetical protein IKT98_07495 [Selenomonadaceae bacterium]|nr:hypothetical protein [Selenomonadaceae bacterium]
MAKVSIEIESTTSSNKKNTTTISYVNPQATNSSLKEFAQMLIALTTDTYEGVTKITKESVI